MRPEVKSFQLATQYAWTGTEQVASVTFPAPAASSASSVRENQRLVTGMRASSGRLPDRSAVTRLVQGLMFVRVILPSPSDGGLKPGVL